MKVHKVKGKVNFDGKLMKLKPINNLNYQQSVYKYGQTRTKFIC